MRARVHRTHRERRALLTRLYFDGTAEQLSLKALAKRLGVAPATARRWVATDYPLMGMSEEERAEWVRKRKMPPLALPTPESIIEERSIIDG